MGRSAGANPRLPNRGHRSLGEVTDSVPAESAGISADSA